MVKVIMGVKGMGKTKRLIEMVTKAVGEESGDVIVIEKGLKLTYDIPHTARLIESSHYDFNGYDFLKGFISGLYAGNYDVTHIFLDSLLKIVNEPLDLRCEQFLDWCESFSERENVKFTIMISADSIAASEGVKKYF